MDIVFETAVKYNDIFMAGAKITIIISFLSCFFGLFLGVILAFMKISGVKILQAVAAVYVEVIRGTPVLVQISLVFLDFRSLESSSLILKYGEWILKGCQPVCWH